MTWPRHDAARRHSSAVVSTARAHSRRTTSSRPQEFAESRVQGEQTRKTVRLRPSGSRNSVHTVRATTKERHCNTARRCTPEGALTLSEHARAFHAKMERGKLQLQPQRPHGGGRAEKSATPQRKMRFQRPSANDICDTRLSHGARPLRSTAVAIAPLPLPACLKILPFQKDDHS